MGKNFNDINNVHIDDEKLVRLAFHISAISYLEKGLSRFTKVLIKDDNQNEDKARKKLEVSDFKKENKKRKVQR